VVRGVDGYQASHRAVRELRAENRRLMVVTVRSCQYLNNMVEQDRGVKRRLRPMLGLKNFGRAITIAGVELLHRIRKDQCALSRLRVRGGSTPAIWNAELAA
jgi:transposase-like protein